MSVFEDPERRCQTTYDPIKRIWSGIKAKPIYDADCSIGKAVIEALLRDPEHICQICHHNGKIYTNHDIAYLSIRVAQHFEDLKVQQCEMIGIVSGNTDYLAPLVFGAMLVGLTICPIETVFQEDAVKDIFSMTKPSMIFISGTAYNNVKMCLEDMNQEAAIFTLDNHIQGVPEITEFIKETGTEKDFSPAPLKYGNNQIAAILRSSGTTGNPKAVSLTHASLLHTYRPKFSRDEVFLRHLSIHWVSGLSRLIGCCLQSVTSVINDSGFKSTMIPEVMEKYGISFIYSTPHLLIDILNLPNVDKIDFRSLKNFHTGGCNAPYSLTERAQILLPYTEFRVVYGSSELCGAITVGPCNREGHVGQLVPNVELKIIDEDENCLGVGEVGEICSKSIFPWQGYYKNPGLTAAVYKNGWVHSGDLGYVNKDGNLFLLDRKKDVFRCMNKSIYPNELEVIIAEIPGVIDVCVCGLPNGELGIVPAALVCKSKDCNLAVEEISQYVADRVEDHKQLRGGVFFTTFIPQTSTGKKLRQRSMDVCEILRGMKSREVKSNMNEDIVLNKL